MRRNVALCFLILLLGACGPAAGNPYALHTVHESTFARVFDDTHLVAVVFGDGRYALVADQNGVENKKLYLVDLERGQERALDLPADVPVMLSELVSAGDVALAVFWDSRTMADQLVYRIGGDGSLRQLANLQYVGRFGEDQPDPDSDDVPALLAAGKMAGLTRWEKEICKWDGETYRATGTSPAPYYFNDAYFVSTNIPGMIAVLDGQSVARVADRCANHADPAAAGFKVVLERIRTPDASQSDLDARILRADLYRDGQFFWRYEFDLAAEYYYWVGIIGERLYFVGNDVKYLDLAPIAGSK